MSKIKKFTHFNIYTDGSCFKGWSGGDIYIRGHRNGKIKIFNRRMNFGKGSNNKGEILAVLQAVRELPYNVTANIFIDSNVAIRALNNKGNDKADELAKEGICHPNINEVESYISKTYSFLVKNRGRTDDNEYNPEPIFNLYTWNKQFRIKQGCNLIVLWMKLNKDSPISKYRYIGYRKNGLIEYKYGQKKMKCHICNKDRTVKHLLDDCKRTKDEITRTSNLMFKIVNSKGELDKINMASNNTRFIGKNEILRKLKGKENRRFKKFEKNYRDNHREEIIDLKLVKNLFENSDKEIKIKNKIKNDWSNIFNPYLNLIEEIVKTIKFWYKKIEESLKWISESMKDCYAIFPPLNIPHSVRE